MPKGKKNLKRLQRKEGRPLKGFVVSSLDGTDETPKHKSANSSLFNVQLNEHLADANVSNRLKTCWKKGQCVSEQLFSFDPKPFKHMIVSNIIDNEVAVQNLSRELLTLPYERMLNDLYSFHQTDSLFDQVAKFPALKSVLDLISGPLRTWVQKITGKKFSSKITATASQYRFTDRLLCHDDNLDDRSVAFIFYLCKDWGKEDGGTLDLFECDSENQPQRVVKSILPQYCSFAFFEVTRNSYHQVAEVLTTKKTRLSINGWFHGSPLPQQLRWEEALPKMLTPINPRGCSIPRWFSPSWLEPKTQEKVKQSFCQELSISLSKFLKSQVYKEMAKALNDPGIVWEMCGPANRRRYERAQEITLPKIVQEYLQLIKCKQWFRLLSEYTVDMDPDMIPKPKCFYEVQRWGHGDYTLLVDDDPLNGQTGIDVHLYFNVAKRDKDVDGGEVHYFGPDRNEEGFLVTSSQLEPESNTATIVARIEGMVRVTNYIDHRNKTSFHKIIANYSQSAES